MARGKGSVLGRLFRDLGHAVVDHAEDRMGRGADRVRRNWHDLKHGGRFTCYCSPGRTFRGARDLNAHHLARHGGYWGGKAGKAMGRKIGKQADAARRHARAWREVHGLIDHRGHATAKGRSRPDVHSTRDLGQAHRHGRHHDKITRHTTKADRHSSRAGHPVLGRLYGRLAAHHQARITHHKERAQQYSRPAPPRPAPPTAPPSRLNGRPAAHANGHPPASGPVSAASRPASASRLAPSRPGRPAP